MPQKNKKDAPDMCKVPPLNSKRHSDVHSLPRALDIKQHYHVAVGRNPKPDQSVCQANTEALTEMHYFFFNVAHIGCSHMSYVAHRFWLQIFALHG